MKTVKTYLVRKPSDLEEVMELTKRYGNEATEVKVAETIRLDEEAYKAVCENPMADYGFLTGKGGYDDDGMRQVVKISNGYPKPVWEKTRQDETKPWTAEFMLVPELQFMVLTD